MRKFIGKALFTLLLGAPALSFAAPYQIDPSHSNAHFKVRHMMVTTVRGEFTKLAGTVQFDPAKPEAVAIDATIDATTIDTREPKRDDHLKSPDFFDVAKHPTITFKSKSAKSKGKGKLAVTGDLTMRGVTKEVVLGVEGLDAEVKDPWGNMRIGAVATTKVNRKDFGLNWNQALEAGGVLVGDEVDIVIDVELIKQAEKTATK
ncbi:MAG TPA: YceI family protein [Vulgatibacter sp.]|nr:YceI family protein [Vulgatibacter sp.]